jgi:protein-S-isoprenylcysteine O-methyltransferase Ste14
MAKTGFRLILVVAAMAAYMVLAVTGEGGSAAFFSHPALVGLVIVGLAAAGAAPFVGGNLSPGVREDRSNRWVIAVLGAIAVVSAWLPAWTDRVGFWTLDGEAIRWVGVVLFGVGCALRLWPVVVLGDRFSGLVAIQPGHRLVTTGIYSVVRNPSYLGLLITVLGWGLAFRSGVGVLLTAITVLPIVGRIRAEERLLRSEFGAEYDAFCARTWRLVPWLY